MVGRLIKPLDGDWTDCQDTKESSKSKNEVQPEMYTKAAYAQIGRLVKLEVLALSEDLGVNANPANSTFEWDLTMSKGCLVELSALKNLRRFEMRSKLWLRMGEAVIEFIDAEWPLLSEIGFGGTTDDYRKLISYRIGNGSATRDPT
ncbi:hypothetical protein BGX28_001762 [Mortierella sp. GBA30]|nr:hypothetical protein BGX28_001762 [Mortierella sp. GBA30]